MKKRLLWTGAILALTTSIAMAETQMEAQSQQFPMQPVDMDGQHTAKMEQDIQKIIGVSADGKQQVVVLDHDGQLRTPDETSKN